MFSINKVSKLQNLACNSVSKLIIETVKHILSEVSIEDLVDQVEIDHKLEKIEKIILFNVPWTCRGDLLTEIIRTLHILYSSHCNNGSLEKLDTTMDCIFKVVSRLKMEQLDCSKNANEILEHLYPHLCNMTELKILNINHNTPLKKISEADMEDLMIRALSNMTNLESLSLISYSTDKIIETVQKNCTKLQSMNGSYSFNLTNKAIQYLVGCKMLREINLYNTSINVLGYVELLQKVPTIVNIGTCKYIKEILIELFSGNPHTKLNLLYLKISRVDMTYLTIISKMLLNLKTLEMSISNITDFTILTTLKHLETISLVSADFNGLKNLLKQIGRAVISLKFVSVKNVDLEFINRMCPNLKTLLIDSCILSSNEFIIDGRYWKQAFNHLEHLICGKQLLLIHLKFLLANCQNVKILGLSDTDDGILDEDIINILQQNRMEHLEHLSFNYNRKLTIRSLEMFAEECRNLKKISGLIRCDAVSETEMKTFVKKYSHLDFETIHCPDFVIEIALLKSMSM